MKIFSYIFIALIVSVSSSFAAIAPNTIWEIESNATANNANAGGFNPDNANAIGDLATTNGTATNAQLTSATYVFTNSDVSAWLFVQSGTSFNSGWYKITSVSGGTGIVNSAIGSAVQRTSLYSSAITNGTGIFGYRFVTNTTAGVGSALSLSSGKFMIDYSQQAGSIIATNDYVSIGSDTNLISLTAGFRSSMVGNYFHQTNSGVGSFGVTGWYEVVRFASSTNVFLDRTPNSGTASASTYGTIGGAMSLGVGSGVNGDSQFFTQTGISTNGIGAVRYVIKNGTYTLPGAILGLNAAQTQAPIMIEGFNIIRVDNPTGTNRPTLAFGSNALTLPASWDLFNLLFTGTGSGLATLGTNGKMMNCKVTCSSTTAGRVAISLGSDTILANCEAICYRGYGVSLTGTTQVYGNWVHDCDVGIRFGTILSTVNCNNIVSSCASYAMQYTSANQAENLIINNTIYGSENKTGIGLGINSTTTDERVFSNIIYGFTNGITHADSSQFSGLSDGNTFFNNTIDTVNWAKGLNDVSINPVFNNVTQIINLGTVTAATNVLTDTSANFSGITDNIDHVYVTGGLGTGFATNIFGITAHSTTNLSLTSNIISAGSGSNVTYQITLGNNFNVGTNTTGKAFPFVFPTGLTTNYSEIGAVQRQTSTTTVTNGGGSFTY